MKLLKVICCFLFFISIGYAKNFSDFVTHLKNEARVRGYSESVINLAFQNVQLMERATYQEKHQTQAINPFKVYYMMIITPERIEEGKEKMRQYQPLLETISKQYHIPSQYIIALWGLETNFGKNMGNYPEFSALTSLAYHSTRRHLFKREVFSALKMLQTKNIPIEKMKGSWAGAMGQCQFMPSAYMLFAVSYKHKGSADIWTSIPDVFASIANYLAEEGWNNRYPVIFEVQMSRDISPHLIGLKKHKTMREWQALGVISAEGVDLLKQKGDYSLLIPDNTSGLAYLVNWNNFRVIMRWNYATFYAISVASLAKQLV